MNYFHKKAYSLLIFDNILNMNLGKFCEVKLFLET